MARHEMTDEQIAEKFFKKKPGRPAAAKAAPAESPEILPAVAERITAAQDLALSTAESEELIALGKTVGQLEMATFFGNISDAAALAAFENVRKSKAWRHLRNDAGEIFPTIDAFCQARLGYSERRLRQVIANRAAIGHEAFEQAERLGLRQIDYNAIKALPASDQELVRRAVEESESRDEVLDLLQELAARHGQEKQALTQQVQELRAESDATNEVLAKKNQRIDKLEREKKLIARLPADEAQAAIKKEASAILADALGAIRGGVRQALIALANDGEDRGANAVFMAGLVGQLAVELASLREEFGLPDVSNAADQALMAEVAAWAPKTSAPVN